MKNQKEYEEILEPIRQDHLVLKMKKFRQHGRISTYQHCDAVARLSYQMDEKLHLHSDKKTLLTGAILHDFYLYDWHEKGDGSHRWHGFFHAERAARQARRHFGVDKNTEHVIRCHMWPLNLTQLPRSREAWIVCLADKAVSIKETLFQR